MRRYRTDDGRCERSERSGVRGGGLCADEREPEIELSYDGEGNVVELEGANDDGRSVLADYDDYRGRPADEVMGELVREIDADGYFAGGVGGREKNIVLKVAEGFNVSER